MTREEAKQAIKNNHKIRHILFPQNLWIRQSVNNPKIYITNAENEMDAEEFWENVSGNSYLSLWSAELYATSLNFENNKKNQTIANIDIPAEAEIYSDVWEWMDAQKNKSNFTIPKDENFEATKWYNAFKIITEEHIKSLLFAAHLKKENTEMKNLLKKLKDYLYNAQYTEGTTAHKLMNETIDLLKQYE